MAEITMCRGSLQREFGGTTIGGTEQEALDKAQEQFDEAYREMQAWANAVQCASDRVESKAVKWFNRKPAISSRPGDKREASYNGKNFSQTSDVFEASYNVFCSVTGNPLDAYLDYGPLATHQHPRSGLAVRNLSPRLFASSLDRPVEFVHSGHFASLIFSALPAVGDPRIPAQKIQTDEDGNVIISHGYTDPLTGQFVEQDIDIYDPMHNGVLGRLTRHVHKNPDGTTTTWDLEYDARGHLLDVEEIDDKGNLVRTTTYKYDSMGRCYRIDVTDADGNTKLVIVYTYYADGSVGRTTTDYSTSPATVIQETFLPPVPEPI